MEKCIFIGYPPDYKGWRFYNPVTKKCIISERAQFDEHYFLGIKTSTPTIIPTSLLVKCTADGGKELLISSKSEYKESAHLQMGEKN
jgi:hypothetical protein